MNNLFNNDLPEITISYKSKVRPSERRVLGSSRDCFELAQAVFNADTLEYTEEFLVVCLNKSNKVLGWVKMSAGGVAGTVVDPKVLFMVALKAGASFVLLMHNHPSGNLKPSMADIELTKRIVEGGKLLDIRVLDHLIVTSESYYSFADEGMI